MVRSRSRYLAITIAISAAAVRPHPAIAGAATGAATEFTQLANNGELIKLLESSGIQVDNQLTQITQLAEQIQNQLNIYQNMLQNTAQLPAHIWGEVAGDLNDLRSIVSQGQAIAFSMSNADDVLGQRFSSYAALRSHLPEGDSFSSTYQTWSDTNRDTIAGTLRAAGLTARQFESEEATMETIRAMSVAADGQMKALQVGHEIAAQQVSQMQKLRGLVAQQMTMMGTWLQTNQTDRDLAQARREQFFRATIPPMTGGRTMEPRW
jgi:P-type conjugative transfer protein TrbJ